MYTIMASVNTHTHTHTQSAKFTSLYVKVSVKGKEVKTVEGNKYIFLAPNRPIIDHCADKDFLMSIQSRCRATGRNNMIRSHNQSISALERSLQLLL